MIKVFVGCAPNYEDAESQAVLEWSIRKHTQSEVDITWMFLSRDPTSPFYNWDTSLWATPFSGFRWTVPELCHFQGKAIYCDSDFIFLDDIKKLWDQEIVPPKVALGLGGGNWRMCCSVFDCAAAREHLLPIAAMKKAPSIHALLNQKFRNQRLVQTFSGDWNNLDGRDGKPLDKIQALHYTCMSTQPQLKYAIPRLALKGKQHWFDGAVAPHPRTDVQLLFDSLLHEATAHGYGISRYMEHEPFGDVSKRHFAGRRMAQ